MKVLSRWWVVLTKPRHLRRRKGGTRGRKSKGGMAILVSEGTLAC